LGSSETVTHLRPYDMARSFAIVALLVATMAVSAMGAKPPIQPTKAATATFGGFPKFSYLGTWWTWKAGWYCNPDPVTGLCTYDPTFGFWWPAKPFLTPIWVGPIQDVGNGGTFALCTVTAKNIVAGGGCSCDDGTGLLTPIGSAGPVRVTGPIGNPTIVPCGNVAIPPVQCNAYQCLCVGATDTATAHAYCV